MSYLEVLHGKRSSSRWDAQSLAELDRLVGIHVFPNRSLAIQEAVDEKLTRLSRSRLARECANLDPAFEKALAEDGIGEELAERPEYREARFAGLAWTSPEYTASA